jgi:hypothetical protein
MVSRTARPGGVAVSSGARRGARPVIRRRIEERPHPIVYDLARPPARHDGTLAVSDFTRRVQPQNAGSLELSRVPRKIGPLAITVLRGHIARPAFGRCCRVTPARRRAARSERPDPAPRWNQAALILVDFTQALDWYEGPLRVTLVAQGRFFC